VITRSYKSHRETNYKMRHCLSTVRSLIAVGLQVCVFVLALSQGGCTQNPPTIETLNLESYGEIELIGARWNKPFNVSKVQEYMEAVSGWHKEKLFDPFKVMVFPEHELVKTIKKGPVVAIRLDGEPDVIFWVPLKVKGNTILIEKPSTRYMRLVAPPSEQTLDLNFASPNK
jgi:hypothetical protein